MRRLLLSFSLLLLLVPSLFAHPVPRENRDRVLVVHVTASALIVDYRLELDETSIVRDLTREEAAKVRSRADLLEIYGRSFADTAGRNLDASLDGQELHFQCTERKCVALDHIRYDYRFVAPWSLKPDVDHKLKFHECNYVTDDFSRLNLYLGADDSVRLVSAKVPDAELMNRTSDQRKPGDGDKLRRAEASFRLANSEPRGVYKPAFPPDDLSYKDEPEDEVAIAKATPLGKAAFAKSWRTGDPMDHTDCGTSSWWASLHDPNSLLHLLLDSRRGLALMLLIAALFGAAHALTPGHGKTLVAAYLVGERGTFWHAILLGIVTTLTHTSAVMVIATIIWFVPSSENAVVTLQGIIGGFLIMGLGLWLLIRRLSGQADHFHFGAGHHHHHHEEENTTKKAGIWQVITLGIGGGLLPCMDAVVLLGFAFSSGVAHLALPLLLAFSAGLAAVLIALGMAVVGAKQFVQRRNSVGGRLHALGKALPIVSAVFVTLMGFWLCYGALAGK